MNSCGRFDVPLGGSALARPPGGYRRVVTAVPARVNIRPAVVEDAGRLAHLHVDVWEDAYRTLMPERVFEERRATIPQRVDRWRSNLAGSAAATTVVEDGAGLIGFVSIGPGRDEDLAIEEEVWALYVRVAWWGKGVGHALLTATLAERPAYLWVLDGNDRAIAFYRRHGFIADGATRTDEYGTEFRMVRDKRPGRPVSAATRARQAAIRSATAGSAAPRQLGARLSSESPSVAPRRTGDCRDHNGIA